MQGCIHNPMEAGEELMNGTPMEINRLIGLRNLAIQRISVVAQVRQRSPDIVPAYGTEYVGVFFPLRGGRGGAKVYKNANTSKDSISYVGNCKALKTANPEPSIFEIFDMQVIEDMPKGLRRDFLDGDVTFSVLVGSREIAIRPSDIKPLQAVEQRNWRNLLMAQMYNNPNAVFPPTDKELP